MGGVRGCWFGFCLGLGVNVVSVGCYFHGTSGR